MAFTTKFLKDLPIYQDVQPYRLHGYSELSEEQQTDCVYEEIDGIHAEDLRNCKCMPRFEEEGFEFIDASSRCHLSAVVFETEDSDMDKIVQDCVQETMQLVKDRLHSRSVITNRLEGNLLLCSTSTPGLMSASSAETTPRLTHCDCKLVTLVDRPFLWLLLCIAVSDFPSLSSAETQIDHRLFARRRFRPHSKALEC
jgi:hypothetical protein